MWVIGTPSQNEWVKKEVAPNVWQEQRYMGESSQEELKSEKERQWRDSELSRTDEFVKLPDYPVDLLPYRAGLRNYPAHADFPNGVRPVSP